jgi:hypothetical protein
LGTLYKDSVPVIVADDIKSPQNPSLRIKWYQGGWTAEEVQTLGARVPDILHNNDTYNGTKNLSNS